MDSKRLLVNNVSTRVKSKDMFMLMALWLETQPVSAKTSLEVRRTGCVLVDQRDRICALESTLESHAIVRAILSTNCLGCDVYVSRFPCAMCTKVMVQAGIRKIYYFPATDYEMDWEHVCRETLSDFIIPSHPNHLNHPNQSPSHQSPSSHQSQVDESNAGATPSTSPIRRASSPRKQPTTLATLVSEKKDKNYRAVFRLVTNNSIGMTLYIPHWDHNGYAKTLGPMSSIDSVISPPMWSLDPSLSTSPALSQRWPLIKSKFEETLNGMNALVSMYANASFKAYSQPEVSPRLKGVLAEDPPLHSLSSSIHQKMDEQADDKSQRVVSAKEAYEDSEWLMDPVGYALKQSQKAQKSQKVPSIDQKDSEESKNVSDREIARYRHAIVLAHLAAKRTDDAKVGVGAVILSKEGRYLSVGWNGYPQKAAHLDYPQAGADDMIEDEDELKYDYVLHAEQNALLWRNQGQYPLPFGTTLVSTKMPCDECSPVIVDAGVTRVIARPQVPKQWDDPARFLGLTYHKLGKLLDKQIFVFE